MNVKAYLTAFHQPDDGPVKVRPIEIPDDGEGRLPADTEAMLALAFHYGQNDFQPVEGCYSLSVGDVVELDAERRFRVAGMGWVRLDADADPTALIGCDARDAARKERQIF